jgi:hypothetical protein
VRKKSNVSKKSKRQGKTEFETDEVRTLLRRASTFFKPVRSFSLNRFFLLGNSLLWHDEDELCLIKSRASELHVI